MGSGFLELNHQPSPSAFRKKRKEKEKLTLWKAEAPDVVLSLLKKTQSVVGSYAECVRRTL